MTIDEPAAVLDAHLADTPAARADPPVVASTALDLASFVAEHYDRLLRLAVVICHDVPDAADAVQAGLEQAWRHRRDLRDPARARPWLDRIVVREAIHMDRRRRSILGRFAAPREITGR